MINVHIYDKMISRHFRLVDLAMVTTVDQRDWIYWNVEIISLYHTYYVTGKWQNFIYKTAVHMFCHVGYF